MFQDNLSERRFTLKVVLLFSGIILLGLAAFFLDTTALSVRVYQPPVQPESEQAVAVVHVFEIAGETEATRDCAVQADLCYGACGSPDDEDNIFCFAACDEEYDFCVIDSEL